MIQLDPWQQEALEHDGDLLLKTGRQVGKTFILSQKCGLYMMNHPASKIIICSLTEDQAKLMIVMILDYLQKNHKNLIAKGVKKPTQNKIYLTNGSEVIARPVGTTGDAVRGFTGNVLVLDECSRFNELIMTSAKPTLLTTGGQIWIASTPFGKKGFFYESYLNKNNRFRVIEVDSVSVINNREISDEWTEKRKTEAIAFLESERKDMTSLQWGQEYLGLFVEDLQQFFPDELIQSALTISRDTSDSVSGYPPFPETVTGDMFCGVDVAGMGDDESVIVSMTRDEDRQRIRMTAIEKHQKTLTTEISRKITILHRKYRYKKIYVDDGGVGFGVFSELMSDDSTKGATEAINNSQRPLNRDETQKKRIMKEDLYFNLLNLMEKRKVRLFNDEDIALSLKSVQYELKDGKFLIYGNYTHITEAIIRACWCMIEKGINIWFASKSQGIVQ